jgi:hypothetical protein
MPPKTEKLKKLGTKITIEDNYNDNAIILNLNNSDINNTNIINITTINVKNINIDKEGNINLNGNKEHLSNININVICCKKKNISSHYSRFLKYLINE